MEMFKDKCVPSSWRQVLLKPSATQRFLVRVEIHESKFDKRDVKQARLMIRRETHHQLRLDAYF